MLEDPQFEPNIAGRDGGALYLGTGSDATMRAVRFRANQAARNGGAVMAVSAVLAVLAGLAVSAVMAVSAVSAVWEVDRRGALWEARCTSASLR